MSCIIVPKGTEGGLISISQRNIQITSSKSVVLSIVGDTTKDTLRNSSEIT